MNNACNLWVYRVFAFLRWWPMVNGQTLRSDLVAGLTGAIIVLPQGVAFATIAGLPPEYGLYSAMVPAIIAALFGSSWHLVSGPTTAISIVIFGTISPLAEPGSAEYIRLALTLTFMVGAIQLIMGMARMGALVNFISHTVVIGFTAGAAILIASSQLKHFFGVNIPRGSSFYETMLDLFQQIGDINPYVTSVGPSHWQAASLVKKYLRRVSLHDRRHDGGQPRRRHPQQALRARGHPYPRRGRPARHPAAAVAARLRLQDRARDAPAVRWQ